MKKLKHHTLVNQLNNLNNVFYTKTTKQESIEVCIYVMKWDAGKSVCHSFQLKSQAAPCPAAL